MRTFFITVMIATFSLGAPISAQNEGSDTATEGEAEKPKTSKVLNASQKNCLSSAETELARRICLGTPAQKKCARSAANRREQQACF